MAEQPTLIAALLCNRIEQPDAEASGFLDILGATDRLDLIDPTWPRQIHLELLLIVRGWPAGEPRPRVAAFWHSPGGGSTKVLDEGNVPRTGGHFDDWWGFPLNPTLTKHGDYHLTVALNEAHLVTLVFRVTSHVTKPRA